MFYFPKHAVVPADLPLLQQIETAAEHLAARMCTLDLSTLGISEYNQRYLSVIIKNLRGVLTLNAYLLALAFASTTKSLSKMVFVDYGGGCGILSFLAVELGVGTVIYNDIYDVSCQDARKIGSALERSAHAYVNGDIEELMQYVQSNSLPVDTVVSYDVIEHIYDLGSYLSKLTHLSDGTMRIVFASSANIHNPIINRQRMRTQYEIEHNNRAKEWGHKERDALQSYLSIRREIIFVHAPHLPHDDIEKLAHATRGLVKHDIEKIVDEYCVSGTITYFPDHPSNTCDPHTGNWAEHLMDTADLKVLFSNAGFEVSVVPGYYDSAGKSYKRLIKETLNMAISRLGAYCLVAAPYYVICANQVSGNNPCQE
jgi:2-polyprenyl-3-methyl-5-hydroxy-6-metoxy-1,4-benzoquinol methylase